MGLGATVTCQILVEHLDQYLARELPQDQQEACEAHLVTCVSCARYLRSYQSTIRLAAASGGTAPEASSDLPEDLVQAILSARRAPRH